jgi:hypothetical protein
MKNYKLTLMNAATLVSILEECNFAIEAITVYTALTRQIERYPRQGRLTQ